MDFSKLSREDLMVGGGGIVLVIGLLAFPWSLGTRFGRSASTRAATESPVRDLGGPRADRDDRRRRRSRAGALQPATADPDDAARARHDARRQRAALVLLLLFIKFIAHVGSFGWGFFVDIILAIVVAAGAWMIAQGKSTTGRHGHAA